MIGARWTLALFLACFSLPIHLRAQGPSLGSVEWEMSYDAGDCCDGTALAEFDGGYFLSGVLVGEEIGDFTGHDVWIIRMDSAGRPLWQRVVGGEGRDEVRHAIESSPDGGCVVAGSIQASGAASADAYLFKVDAGGELLWERTFGGSRGDAAYSVNRTIDGGYVLGGVTASFSQTHYNAYLVKVDAEGMLQWERNFGGPERDYAIYAAETRDGGYILTGQQRSFDPERAGSRPTAPDFRT